MKTALITGSTKGIGKELALTLASNGYTIILNGRNENPGLLKKIQNLQPNSIFIKADISNYKDCQEMAEIVKKNFSHLDVLINNAAITKDKTFKNMSKEEWYDVINTNINSLYNVTHPLLELMTNGHIINMSSIVAKLGNFGQTNYSSSKAAIIGFTKSLAKELKEIKVNVIMPGFIKTEMTDKIPQDLVKRVMDSLNLTKIFSPKDVAKEVLYILSTDVTGKIFTMYD